MKQKLLSILALLLMTATGAWAQKDTPLTLEAKASGQIVVENPPVGMQYKKNDEEKKTITEDYYYDAGGKRLNLNVDKDDKVQFFGKGTSITSYSGTKIGSGYTGCYIYGNIMSLVDEENFATATELTDDNTFQELFKGCTNLYSHPTNKLVLPATTLTENCYRYMFVRCENLTVAPELPATTLADDCYDSMFDGCTSLTTAPALPATTLETYCYYNMFYGCTSLTVAPELPATTLAYGCYAYMFEGCTSLTTAPALPATTLETRCYNNMFKGCTKLNSVTCLATNISASNATTGWLSGVSDAGTFTKAAGMTGWTSDGNGIPDGWTKNNIATLTDGSSIADQLKCPGESCTLTYTRAFTADKPSTVCLPFAYAPKTGETFYTFSGITKEGDKYVATMTEHTGATLAANTPYLYKSAATGDTDFSGTYTMPATISAGETASGDWKFVGTYETQEWTTAPTGIYGFSAQATGGISQGEFVKVGAYVKVKPMRAYLKYKDGGEDYAGARSMDRAASSETLPETISVRLIDAEGNVTGIGTLETRTGEVRFDPEAWYTLNGVRLSGQPTQKGIYVNNGKKVIIK
ncbi:MAG: leucine-rich repeat protein [Prevotella sp.]|nr:leucine-rich repeat protein [Prevotella sp.]MBQ8153296.1 leucine-rich repeat protein [Prevotella sp.]